MANKTPSSFRPGNTLMTDSIVGDQWITTVCRDNPAVMLPGEGRLISSGPVRLAFTDQLFTPRAPSNNAQGTPKYSVCALYPPYADLSIYYAEYYRICGEMFADFFNPHVNSYSGLESPFHDAALKAHQFMGYTPGLTYINHTSKFKPPITDASPAKNLITDPSKVYPGVWGILVCNAYGYGKTPPQPKKGVSFGLQAVMVIGDDLNLAAGGGGVDVKEVFKGVNIRPPMVNPAQLAGMVPSANMPPPGAPPMTGGRPGAGAMVPPPPPNPLYQGMAQTTPATDDPYDISSIS